MNAKNPLTLLGLSPLLLPFSSLTAEFTNVVRMVERGNSSNPPVIWDLPGQVSANGTSVAIEESVPEDGAIFVLRTIESSPFKDWFLDQTAVGAYLPRANVTLKTHDTNSILPRVRVDQPIEVSIEVSGLYEGELTSSNDNVKQAATEVRLQRFRQDYAGGANSLPGGVMTSDSYLEIAIQGNGDFPTLQNRSLGRHIYYSHLGGNRPDRARGEEHFVVRSLEDTGLPGESLDQVAVEVWPMWNGKQKGLLNPDLLPYQFSGIEAEMTAKFMGPIQPNQNYKAKPGEVTYQDTPPNMIFTWTSLYPDSDVGIIVNDASIPHPWGGRWVTGARKVVTDPMNDWDSAVGATVFKMSVTNWGDIFNGPGRYAIWMVTNTPGIGWEIGGQLNSDGTITEGGWIVPIQRPKITLNGSIHSLSE